MAINVVTISDDWTPEFLWRNGEFVAWEQATIHINAVGHASVAGVFEGLKAYKGDDSDQLYLFRLREHMQRYVESARLSRLHLDYGRDELCAAVVELLRRNGIRRDIYVRPYSFARGIVRQLMVPENVATETVIDCWPFDTSLRSLKGCKAAVSSWRRLDDTITPPRVKAFSNYHNGRFAMMEAKRGGYDSAIMLDGNGKVSEGPASCLVMVRNGRIVTPSTTSSILESITRDTMLTIAREDMALEVVERQVDRSELYLADELFFVGTAWEILPVIEIDGLAVGDGGIGPVARGLDARYADLVRGRAPDTRGWLTPVWDE